MPTFRFVRSWRRKINKSASWGTTNRSIWRMSTSRNLRSATSRRSSTIGTRRWEGGEQYILGYRFWDIPHLQLNSLSSTCYPPEARKYHCTNLVPQIMSHLPTGHTLGNWLLLLKLEEFEKYPPVVGCSAKLSNTPFSYSSATAASRRGTT